jgi:arginyl-tRNA synthetase
MSASPQPINVFADTLDRVRRQALLILPPGTDVSRIQVEPPRDSSHGDIATNAAMVLAKSAGRNPLELANAIADELRKEETITDAQVVPPGFINLRMNRGVWEQELRRAVAAGINYGRNDIGKGELVNVEYVSANPTGPMHVGHGRGAVFGDALANLLSFTGYKVIREYYVNDAGAQIEVLARSAYLRYREALGENIGTIPEGLYPGEYLKPVGAALVKQFGSTLKDMLEEPRFRIVRKEAIKGMMRQIRRDLVALGIHHDQFFSELSLIGGRTRRPPEEPSKNWRPEFIQTVYEIRVDHPTWTIPEIKSEVGIAGFKYSETTIRAVISHLAAIDVIKTAKAPSSKRQSSDRVAATIDLLSRLGYVYVGRLPPPKGAPAEDWDEREQTLFRSTDFGDDVDRALMKSDGSYTYFATDIAYHANKIERGFHALIDVWGADHAGYIKRMQAAVAALSDRKVELDVRVIQLVKLLRAGEPVKMSKRTGEFITLREVVDEVGRDAVRFMMLFRKNDAVLDFDLAKVIEQSRDNPVFYVQYGHARGQSIFRNARAAFPDLPEDVASLVEGAELERLSDPAELALMRQIALYPRVVEAAAAAHEPHRIAFYLFDLASEFHALYTLGNTKPHLRFIIQNERQMTVARLVLVQGVVTVLSSGLALLGVEAPNEMR